MRAVIIVIFFVVLFGLVMWFFPILAVSGAETFSQVWENLRTGLIPLLRVLGMYVLLAGAPLWIVLFIWLMVRWSTKIADAITGRG